MDKLRRKLAELMRENRAAEAMQCIGAALRLEPDNASLLSLSAQVLLSVGHSESALAAVVKARALAPRCATAAYTEGRVLRALGHLSSACVAYRRALLLEPDHLDAHLSLGIALKAQGKLAKAIAVYREALSRHPASSIAWRNLASALQSIGEVDEARGCIEKAVNADRAALEAALIEGEKQTQLGHSEAALEAFMTACELAPQELPPLFGKAEALTNLLRVDEAIGVYRRIVEVAPSTAPAWQRLGDLFEWQGLTADSSDCYDKAIALGAGASARICRDLLLPTIVPVGTDLAQLRAKHEQKLRDLLQLPLRVEDPLAELSSGAVNNYFRLAYHGYSNRSLHELHARLYLAACPSLTWVSPTLRQRERGLDDDRIRVGFISRFFRQHSIGKTSVGLIERLARPEFHVTALFLPPKRDDDMAARISNGADASVHLPTDLGKSRELIAELDLDILFFQDIGMEPHSYFLAFARLAHVQCVSFGHPDTTGIPNMDCWISSEDFEPPGAAAHYSERLIMLKGVGTLAYYDRPVLQPDEAIGRSGFELPEGVPLLACPQALFKFHLDMDDLIAAALKRLPGAKLLLVQGDVPASRQQLIARWRARGDGIDQAAIFFPYLAQQSFLALLSIADVVLDPVHFNGMNSSLEALAMGTPVVTLPKAFQRGRHTQAMYRRMGYTDLIASDESNYVDLIHRLVTDIAFADRARHEIRERCGVLFHEEAVVRGFEAAFRTLIEERRSVAVTHNAIHHYS